MGWWLEGLRAGSLQWSVLLALCWHSSESSLHLSFRWMLSDDSWQWGGTAPTPALDGNHKSQTKLLYNLKLNQAHSARLLLGLLANFTTLTGFSLNPWESCQSMILSFHREKYETFCLNAQSGHWEISWNLSEAIIFNTQLFLPDTIHQLPHIMVYQTRF